MDNTTRALNLWDIETRIRAIHKELDALNEMKDNLIAERDLVAPSDFLCE